MTHRPKNRTAAWRCPLGAAAVTAAVMTPGTAVRPGTPSAPTAAPIAGEGVPGTPGGAR